MGGRPSPGTNLCGEGDKVPGGEDVVVAHHSGGWREGLPEEHWAYPVLLPLQDSLLNINNLTISEHFFPKMARPLCRTFRNQTWIECSIENKVYTLNITKNMLKAIQVKDSKTSSRAVYQCKKCMYRKCEKYIVSIKTGFKRVKSLRQCLQKQFLRRLRSHCWWWGCHPGKNLCFTTCF